MTVQWKQRNAHVFEKLASEMKDTAFDRSATQCTNKIKKLRGEYRKRKDKKDHTQTDTHTHKTSSVTLLRTHAEG